MKTTEVLSNNGPSLTSRSKFEKNIVHYKKNIRISNKRIVGIDIPLTISLPDDIKDTNFNGRFGHSFTSLECNVSFFSTSSSTAPVVQPFCTTVNVERFDILATQRLFPPLKRQFTSPDKKFLITYKLENPCLTVDDLLHLELKVMPNLSGNSFSHSQKIFSKKLKLKSVVFEIKEYLEIYDSHFDAKENTLQTVSKPFNEVIGNSGLSLESDIRVFTKNHLLRQYEVSMNEPAVMYQLPPHEPNFQCSLPHTTILKSKNSIEPFAYHNSVTTRGKLFSITHGLTMKFKISNARDFEISQPIDISPWTKSHIKSVEQIIFQEREIAKNAKNFYGNFGGIKRNKHTGYLEYPPLPPVVYTADPVNLKNLGVSYDTGHKHPRRIPVIE